MGDKNCISSLLLSFFILLPLVNLEPSNVATQTGRRRPVLTLPALLLAILFLIKYRRHLIRLVAICCRGPQPLALRSMQ